MRAFLLIGAGRVLLLLLALANVRLYTELLSAAEVGRLSILLGLTTVLSVLVDRSIGAYWYRMLVPWNQAGVLRHRLPSLIGWLAMIGLVGATLCALVSRTLGFGVSAATGWIALLAFSGIVINSLFSAVAGSLNILGERARFVVMSITGSALGLALATATTARIPVAEWWVTGTFGAQLLVLMPAIWVLSRRLNPGLPGATALGFDVAAWARFAGPTVISAALYSLQLMGYRFVLNAVAGTTVVGYFTVAFGLGVAAMNAFDYLITQLVQPRFFRRLAGADATEMASAWDAYARAVVPAVILMAAFAGSAGPLLLRIGAASPFGTAGRLVIWGVAADALRILAQLFAMVPHATLQTRRLVVPGAIAVLVSLASGGALATIWPLSGMGIGLVLGGLVWLALSYRVAHDLLPVRVPWRQAGLALLASLPVVAGLEVAVRFGVTDRLATTLGALAAAGAVMMLAQAAFARRWLADVNAPAEPPVTLPTPRA